MNGGARYLILRPLSFVFVFFVFMRRLIYQTGLFKKIRLNRPVISVGNITVGGTGKTPFVDALLYQIENRGLFAGVSLEGSTLRPDNDATADVYGRKLTAKEIILGGEAKTPVSGRHLVAVLKKHSPRDESAKN